MITFDFIINIWIFCYDSPFYITRLYKSNPMKQKLNHSISMWCPNTHYNHKGLCTKRNYSKIYQESLHKRLPFYTQLLFVNLVPKLYQQRCPLPHLGPHLSSLSMPTVATKQGKHELRAKR